MKDRTLAVRLGPAWRDGYRIRYHRGRHRGGHRGQRQSGRLRAQQQLQSHRGHHQREIGLAELRACPGRLTALSAFSSHSRKHRGEGPRTGMIRDVLLLTIFPGAMAFAAATDLFTMTVPNRLVLVLTAGFFILAPMVGLGWADIGLHVALAAAGPARDLRLVLQGLDWRRRRQALRGNLPLAWARRHARL